MSVLIPRTVVDRIRDEVERLHFGEQSDTMVGRRLTGYTDLLDTTVEEMLHEIEERGEVAIREYADRLDG